MNPDRKRGEGGKSTENGELKGGDWERKPCEIAHAGTRRTGYGRGETEAKTPLTSQLPPPTPPPHTQTNPTRKPLLKQDRLFSQNSWLVAQLLERHGAHNRARSSFGQSALQAIIFKIRKIFQ